MDSKFCHFFPTVLQKQNKVNLSGLFMHEAPFSSQINDRVIAHSRANAETG